MFSSMTASAIFESLRTAPRPLEGGRVMRGSVRRRLGMATSANFRGEGERLTMKTVQWKGSPGWMGEEEGGLVKVMVMPKSGMEGLRECRVVISMVGKESGWRALVKAGVGELVDVLVESMDS